MLESHAIILSFRFNVNFVLFISFSYLLSNCCFWGFATSKSYWDPALKENLLHIIPKTGNSGISLFCFIYYIFINFI
ncbi:hypothetical protein CDL12_01662 [Handroanthus impetiginosus]|uniref:Uncharacterized protein n=1 Tax=Handroanthus impetiginosus TaxID=429701 RepID=A0A2G9I764_9LAMI|nr:hypothetical protein CDL12_01662 [Handroanthus impetiginosus]